MARPRIGYIVTLVVGDVNIHDTHGSKFSASVSVGAARSSKFCWENGSRQLVKAPTHKDGWTTFGFIFDRVAEVGTACVLPRVRLLAFCEC